jgi:arylsulfatase A-like enzyme
MDEQVGRLAQELERLGIDDRTMVLFCSDNGPTWVHELGTTGGLRGRKGSIFEGGIRVPAFVRWPDKIPGGKPIDVPISTSDLMPTVLSAAGAPIPEGHHFDGENVLPVLTRSTATRTRPIGFQSPRLLSQARDTKAWRKRGGRQMAWMEGDYKLISVDEGKTWSLFDLRRDPGEKHDLAAEQPQRVAAMRARCEKWGEDCRRSRGK